MVRDMKGTVITSLHEKCQHAINKLGDNNPIKKLNAKVTDSYECVRKVTIGLMAFSCIGIAWELIMMIIKFKFTNWLYLVEQLAYAVEGFLFVALIVNYKPERLAFFRKLVLASTIVEALFIIDIVFDIF